MEVLYIDHCGAIGGGGRSLYEMIAQLKNRGISPRIICQRGEMAASYSKLGCPIIKTTGISQFDNTRYSYYRKFRWLVLIREIYLLIHTVFSILYARIKWRDIGLIHINDYTLLPAAIIAKYIFMKPLIVHCRCYQQLSSKSLRAKTIASIYNKMQATIISINEDVQATIGEISRKTVIQNSFDESIKIGRSRGDSRFERSESLALGFVGSISIMKGILETIEAVGLCVSRGENVKLYVAGTVEKTESRGIRGFLVKKIKGYSTIMDEINILIEKYSIRDRIIFSGYISDLSTYYSSIDVLCFTTRLNGPGRPVFEAGVFSKPSIITAKRSWKDTIIDGETGLIAYENTPNCIADKISFFYKNRKEILSMGKNAKKMTEKYNNPKKNADALLRIYTRVK